MPKKVRNHVTFIQSAGVLAKEDKKLEKKVTAEKKTPDPKDAKAVLEKNTKKDEPVLTSEKAL